MTAYHMTATASNLAGFGASPLAPRKFSAPIAHDILDVLAKTYSRLELPKDTFYAHVIVDGELLASVTNNGHMQSSHVAGTVIQRLLRDESGLCGPELAQHRAERIAADLGGEVCYADSAMSQSEWYARPVPNWRIDFAEMEKDGYIVPQDYRNARFRSAEMAEHTIKALLNYQTA